MEKTLILIKPDAFEKEIHYEIFIKLNFEANLRGYSVEYKTFNNIHLNIMESHYEEHKGKHFYERLINFMTKGLITAIIIEGDDCVSEMRKVAMNIRDNYETKNERNLVHASDSIESAEREIKNIFGG